MHGHEPGGRSRLEKTSFRLFVSSMCSLERGSWASNADVVTSTCHAAARLFAPANRRSTREAGGGWSALVRDTGVEPVGSSASAGAAHHRAASSAHGPAPPGAQHGSNGVEVPGAGAWMSSADSVRFCAVEFLR